MKNSTTIKEIADTLGLSRNTVSRVLNNRDTASEKTRNRVLEAAANMGYLSGIKNIYGNNSNKPSHQITFLTRASMTSSFFCTSILSAAEETLSLKNYSLNFIALTPEQFQSNSLPQSIKNSDGVICVDILDASYLSALFSTGLPIVTIDCYWDCFKFKTPYTVIMMECVRSVNTLTTGLLNRGHKKIAFMGDHKLCRGLYERHRGYLLAHAEQGILPDLQLHFSYKESNVDDMMSFLKKLPQLPTAYVCVTDFDAVHLLMALMKMGVSVPEEAEIVGFGDWPQSQTVSPAITTVHTYPELLGKRAAIAVQSRIENPSKVSEVIYHPTSIIYRGTTRK